MLSNFYKTPTFYLIVTLTILAISLFAVWLNQKEPTSTPSSNPVIIYSPPPSSKTSLSTTEQALPEAKAQKFFDNNSGQYGILVVTSNPSGARVLIDSEDAEGPSDQKPLPVNLTPFKASSVPVGKHNLTVSSPGYNYSVQEITVEPNQITRIQVELVPQEKNIGY